MSHDNFPTPQMYRTPAEEEQHLVLHQGILKRVIAPKKRIYIVSDTHPNNPHMPVIRPDEALKGMQTVQSCIDFCYGKEA